MTKPLTHVRHGGKVDDGVDVARRRCQQRHQLRLVPKVDLGKAQAAAPRLAQLGHRA